MPNIVVTLTSWPARINLVGYTLYSILVQSVKPNSIELNLSKSEFPGLYNDLPTDLHKLLQHHLININFIDANTYTFKKLIPTLNKYRTCTDYIVLTIDDDCIYMRDYIKCMLKGLNSYDTYCPCKFKVCGNRMIYRSSVFLDDFIDCIIPQELLDTRVDDTYIQCYLEHVHANTYYEQNSDIARLILPMHDICPTRNVYNRNNRISIANTISKKLWP